MRTSVDSGALQMALNVLERAGKQEVADALRATAVRGDDVAVPAVLDWRPVMQELADDLSIELDMRYQSRHQYPSEQRRFENEMQPVYQARALLQSFQEPKS